VQGGQQRHVAVVGAEAADLLFAVGDLFVELIDQLDACIHG
jgi:hypothetical protein